MLVLYNIKTGEKELLEHTIMKAFMALSSLLILSIPLYSQDRYHTKFNKIIDTNYVICGKYKTSIGWADRYELTILNDTLMELNNNHCKGKHLDTVKIQNDHKSITILSKINMISGLYVFNKLYLAKIDTNYCLIPNAYSEEIYKKDSKLINIDTLTSGYIKNYLIFKKINNH